MYTLLVDGKKMGTFDTLPEAMVVYKLMPHMLSHEDAGPGYYVSIVQEGLGTILWTMVHEDGVNDVADHVMYID
jgi:hypothetical protein